MAECYKCGISGNEARLFDAITKEGIFKICNKCLGEEDIPVIRKPTTFQLKESEKPPTVYERLSRVAGISSEEHKEKFSRAHDEKKQLLEKQETTLREIVDRNYEEKIKDQKKEEAGQFQEKPKRADLIDNFHWILMRARRRKKLTQEQLANEIAESKTAIEMAEKGILPEDDYRLVNKLEVFLGVRIIKPEARPEPAKPKFGLDENTTKELTISDLKEMKSEIETKKMSQEISDDIQLNEEFKIQLNEVLAEDRPEFVEGEK